MDRIKKHLKIFISYIDLFHSIGSKICPIPPAFIDKEL